MTFAGASVENHVVVITGGGTGIGAAIADRFAAEGARVVLLGRRAGPPSRRSPQRTGGLPIVADAGDAVSVKAAVATIIATYGRVDTQAPTALRQDGTQRVLGSPTPGAEGASDC